MEARKVTNDLLQAIEDGFVDKDTVLMACLKYMSEDDVKDMCKANEFNIVTDEDDYIDEYSLDELDSVLNEKFKSATLWNEEDEPVVVDNDCIFEFNIHLYGEGEKDNYKQLEHHFDYIIAEDDVMYYGIKVDDSSMEDIYVTGTSNKKFTLNLTGWDCISRYDIKFNPLVD